MTNQSSDKQPSERLMRTYAQEIANSPAYRVTNRQHGTVSGMPHTIKLSGPAQTLDLTRTTATKVAPSVTISYLETLQNTELDLYKGLGWNVWKRWKMCRAKKRADKIVQNSIARSQQNIEKHCETLMLTGQAQAVIKAGGNSVIDWENIDSLT